MANGNGGGSGGVGAIGESGGTGSAGKGSGVQVSYGNTTGSAPSPNAHGDSVALTPDAQQALHGSRLGADHRDR